MGLLDRMKKFKKDYIDNAPPAVDGRDPYWTRSTCEDRTESEGPSEWEELYDEDHFYSIENQCWVRRDSLGRFYRSISYEDWDLGIYDDESTERLDVDPDRLLTRQDYDDLDNIPHGYP